MLFFSTYLNFFCVPLYLQSRLSVQFDDLFKKAWEEDAVEELTRDGEFRSLCSYWILWCLDFMRIFDCEKTNFF